MHNYAYNEGTTLYICRSTSSSESDVDDHRPLRKRRKLLPLKRFPSRSGVVNRFVIKLMYIVAIIWYVYRGKQATSDSEIDSPAKHKISDWSSDSEVVSPVKQ